MLDNSYNLPRVTSVLSLGLLRIECIQTHLGPASATVACFRCSKGQQPPLTTVCRKMGFSGIAVILKKKKKSKQVSATCLIPKTLGSVPSTVKNT